MFEEIDGQKLLVRKQRPASVAQALLAEDRSRIVEAADAQVECDKFVCHKLKLINSSLICFFYS